MIGLCLGGLLAWGLGFADNIFYLRTRWKLLVQIGIAVLAISLGFKIETVQVPFFLSFSLGLWSWTVTVLWIVGMENAVNLIDGFDGFDGEVGIA